MSTPSAAAVAEDNARAQHERLAIILSSVEIARAELVDAEATARHTLRAAEAAPEVPTPALPSSSRPGPLIVTGDGRTTALCRWVTGGHPLSGYPGWSRILVVQTAHRVPHVAEVLTEMTPPVAREAGCVGGRLVMHAGEVRNALRGASIDVEIALDDVDARLGLPQRVAVVALPGTVVDAADAFR